MDTIGQQIREARKQKGLTQEQLAEQVERNLRTIQRIENSENAPRNETLSLICEALEISLEEAVPHRRKYKTDKIANQIIHWAFLVILNFVFIGLFGWTTISHEAGLPSKLAVVLLSFFIPHFIVLKTEQMSGIERMLKFGTGLVYLLGNTLIDRGFSSTFGSGLITSTVILLGVLFYGNEIVVLLKLKKDK